MTHNKWNNNKDNHNTRTKNQAFSLFTHSEGSTMPSETKSGYTISHSDLSKLMVETEPPHGARARVASIFDLLDFLRGAPTSAVCRHQGFLDEVACE
jgi:hypothetical protein